MENKISNMAKKYKVLNEMAIKGEIVVFGSTYLLNFPFYDFMQHRISDYAIYNRSIENLCVKDGLLIVEEVLKFLSPNKILLCFGENEKIDNNFFNNYKLLISKIKHLEHNIQICITSNLQREESEKIEKFATENNIEYLNILDEINDEKRVMHRFSYFFRKNKISFDDAFFN